MNLLPRLMGTRELLIKEGSFTKKKKPLSDSVNSSNLKWTGSKVDLVELVCAMQASGMVNNGNIGIKELAKGIENLFAIELSDYYRIFLEIRTRKSNPSKLLDTLTTSLKNKIAEADG